MIQIHKHRLDRERNESSPEEIVGVLFDKKLSMTQQCTLSSPERQLCPGLHQKQHGQQIKGRDSAPLFHAGETSLSETEIL